MRVELPEMKKNIVVVIDKINRDRITNLLVDAVNSYSPTFAETQAIHDFAAALGQAGITYSFQPVPWASGDDERANLLVHLGPAPLALLLVGHVDTVELWHEGEHGARMAGDNLYGLGAADMKGGCVAMVEALTAVVESDISLERGLCAAFVVGEEEDGDGAEALVKRVNAPLTVIGEPTNLAPCINHFGYLETRLVVNGQRAHAALPEEGANAIHAMLAWMMHIIAQSEKLPFAQQLAVNPREIHGGEPYFVVAERCEVMIDFHVPPHVKKRELDEAIRKAKNVTASSHPHVELFYEHLSWASGFSHHDGDTRLHPLRSAYRHLELPWQPTAFRSHSDANVFNATGTLPVVCGPGDLAVAHGRNEFVSISDVEQAARLYAALICEACT